MNSRINTAIIGYGLAGRVFHAPFIHTMPEFGLRKIISTRTEEIKSVYPHVNVSANPEDAFNDKEIDLVIIATPNTSHFSLTKQALLNGKHVIVDKPFTTSSAEAIELINISHERKKILSVFHNRRWDGDFMTVQKIIKKGLLGRIVEFESHFDRYKPEFDPEKWRNQDKPGSGVLFDLGPHLIDQAVCLFGKPQSVWADIRNQRGTGEVDDYFEIQLNYKNLKAILKAGVLVREPGPRFILHGTEGSFVKYGLDPQEENLKKGFMPVNNDLGVDRKDLFGKMNTNISGLHFEGFLETIPGDYSGYFRNVYQAIFEAEKLAVTPEDARLTIEIIEKAFQSQKKDVHVF